MAVTPSIFTPDCFAITADFLNFTMTLKNTFSAFSNRHYREGMNDIKKNRELREIMENNSKTRFTQYLKNDRQKNYR